MATTSSRWSTAPVPASIAAVAIAVALTGCGATGGAQAPTTTVVATATVTQVPGSATPPVAPMVLGEWTGGPSGNGVFSVGAIPVDGLTAAIPPGRYQVRLAPDATKGAWMLCNSPMCGLAFQQNATAAGQAEGPDFYSTIDITAQDRAVWLFNVVLKPDSA